MRHIAELALIAILYLALAKLSLRFASINPSATPIWPPAGFALAMVLLRGARVWPAILAGALAANLATAGTPLTSTAIAIGNTLEALCGAWCLNRWAGGVRAFDSQTGVGKFAIIVTALATPVSATIGVLSLSLGGFAAWPGFGAIWTTWWLGDLAGAFVVTPVIVLWTLHPPRPTWRLGHVPEAVLVLLLTIAVGVIAYSPLQPRGAGGHNGMAFLAILPLMWAALRCGQRDTATAALILSGFAVWGAIAGKGPFVMATLNDSFLLLVAFMISVAAPSLALSAGVASRARALAASEDNFRLLMESVRDYAIYMLDAGGRVVSWNSGAASLKGYRAEEIIGEHFSRFYTPEDRQDGAPERALAAAAETGAFAAEGWRLHKDGHRFWASVVIDAVRDPSGVLIGFAKVTRDITERREAQAALEATREQLVQAQKLEALGQLTGGIAHDFNNLLMIIGGQADILRSRLTDERALVSIDAIRTAAQRAASLTRQLLAFARRQRLTPQVVNLRRQAEPLRSMLESSLGAGIELKFDVPRTAWAVEVDLAEFELALVNLAINARDAMSGRGSLIITARNAALRPGESGLGLTGEFLAISVADTGAGMEPDVLARAFDPFFTTKPEGKGTGLGLSQVYGFAHQSGGTVRAASNPGAGTTITVYLPRTRKSPSKPDAKASAEPRLSGRGRVLLVEDNLDVAEVSAAMLERLGYEVARAPSAQAALVLLEEDRQVDLVFSDIVMPGTMDGMALAHRVRALHPSKPVLLTTGFSRIAVANDGTFDILHKPFDLTALADALDKALRNAKVRPAVGGPA